MNKDGKLTFLGTGTSQGVPVIACNCTVCVSNNKNNKRLRTSVLISFKSINFCIDTGPDFRQQMLRENIQELDAVLFTHQHKDHVAGLDDVRAFNFKSKQDMPIFCTQQVLSHLEKEFYYIFDPNNKYPGIPKINANIINEKPFIFKGIEIIPLPVYHHKMPVLGFRINNLAYITDANYIPPATFELLQDIDILVLNALRKEDHISHFNLAEALEIIKIINPKKAYLTHISHLMGDHDQVSTELPEKVHLAFDGLSINF